MALELRIDQALHGYRDGHRLLAASRRIDGREATAMARLSDLSGSFSRNFPPSYLTGYPITSLSCYALARTWLADEMPRPGSVWTHTLLISVADLAVIKKPLQLLGLFHRPTAVDDQDRFRKPLFVRGEELAGPAVPCLDERIVYIIECLYFENPDGVVRVPHTVADHTRDDALVLAIWNQQWPRLQRAFRFCTYAAAERSDESGAFDLQVMPEEKLSTPSGSTWSDAVAVAARDMASPGMFRDFLRRYGVDIDATRRNFGTLAKVYGSIEPSISKATFHIALEAAASLTPIGERKKILEKLCGSALLSPAEAGAIVAKHPEFGVPLIDNSPTLIHSAAFWKHTETRGPALIDRVSPERIDPPFVKALIEGVPNVAISIFQQPKVEHFYAAYLQLVQDEPGRHVPEIDSALLQHDDVSLDVVKRNSNLFAPLLEVTAGFVLAGKYRCRDPQKWLSVAASVDLKVLDKYPLSSLFLLFALACKTCSPEASRVLLRTFEDVHDFAAFQAPGSSWRLVEDSLTPDWYWFEWDRCRRLRRTVVSKWVECAFDPADFLELVREPELFRQLCHDANTVTGGEVLLEQAARAAEPTGDSWFSQAREIIHRELAGNF